MIDSIADEAPVLTAIRRDLHAHPELGFDERRTSDRIAQLMGEWGIPVHRGLGKTGVVGILKNGTSVRALGLRADMDALPIAEENAFPHRSTRSGQMHACGHDGHTAMLLSAAKYLSAHRNFDGTVYLIFQPAEEGGGGAREMIKDGLFDRFPMDAVFGAHNWPGMPVGQFALRSGPVCASNSDFKILVRGRGSHAAMPHSGVDPVPIACQIVQSFQTLISRNKRPIDAGVISVTILRAGEALNVVPDFCEMQGTVRTFSGDALDLIEQRMRRIAKATCEAFDARCDFEFTRKYPPTVNDSRETDFVRKVLGTYFGSDNVKECEPTLGSEDFSYFLLQKPGCYFVMGNGDGAHRLPDHGGGPCVLHNASYDFNDALIPIGGSAWVRLVEAWFAR